MNILVLNAGSSSQKSCLYALADELPNQPPTPIWEAHIDWTATPDAGLMTVRGNDNKIDIKIPAGDRPKSLQLMLDTLIEGRTQVLQSLQEIDGVGHRVVHGGSDYAQPVRITASVKETIAKLIPLAPAHNPVNLEGIETLEQSLGDIPQVAVFDTAFHSQMPPAAAVYPIPYAWLEKGVKRYGFHGISHEYCSHRAAQILQQPLESLKLVTCHLGNGCSLTAIRQGQSVSTTMGFTPLEGLMMGSRSGSIDPAIPLYLMRDHGMTADQVDHLLNKESGLKGVSGISSDLRDIQQAIANGHDRATLAFDIYIHRLRASIASLIPALGGLDALVFTAGVGEHSSAVRDRTCAGLSWLGVHLDLDLNEADPRDQDIAKADSSVRVLVIHTEEDWAIAQACWHLLRS
ncbi:MAG: acetate kinase [Elainellaceae cyanobacterium]